MSRVDYHCLTAALVVVYVSICQRRKKAKAAAASSSGTGIPAVVSSRDTSRDEEFFIGVDDSDSHGFSEESLRVRGNSDSNDNRSAIEEAVMTLTSDEAGELVRTKRSMMRWDSRKMKYVETNSLNDRSRTKNEAGVMVSKKDEKAGKETIYQSWVQKTNQRIPKAGTMESETAERCVVCSLHALALTHTHHTPHRTAPHRTAPHRTTHRTTPDTGARYRVNVSLAQPVY